MDLSEANTSDALLEYIIEGVMIDIKGFLLRELISYEEAWNLATVPLLLKRATTYGTVASMFARGYLGIRDRIQPSMGPRTITVIEPELLDTAMEYWEEKMMRMLSLYASTVYRKVIWVSTEDEEPVFTMDFSPQDTVDPSGVYG